ncbi:MAG: Tfp pilus assembly protein FimV [Candidatus Aldehydirespiratoraceae bacterium]|jgi:Tfp pilus assembly protein FimV
MTAALLPKPALAAPRRAVRSASEPQVLSAETYRRRRLAVLAVIIGLVLGLASFGRQADATPTAEAQAAEAVLVVVQPGDTLWTIAQNLAPDSDPRPLVTELVEIAGGASILPGQLLTIPGHVLD